MQSQHSRPPDSFRSPHSRWHALTHRVPSSHSSFLYGVKSTKIYCRPTCSARLARRANVVFYDTEDQARSDGFRPCKRCKPDDTRFIGEREEIVTKVMALLRNKKDDSAIKGGLKGLAEEVGVTQSYLCRVFKSTMGITIGAYMRGFETEASEGEAEHSTRSSGFDTGMGLLTPATTVETSPASVKDWDGGLADEHVGKLEEGLPTDSGLDMDLGFGLDLDLDLDFNFDEWLWTEDFTKDLVY